MFRGPRRAASASAASAAGEQHPLLEVDRLVLASDAGQIARRRMAFRAAALAVEERFARGLVARQDVPNGEDRGSAEGIVDALTQEVREIDDLLVRDGRRRTGGMPLLQKRSELAAVAIVQHERGP